MRGVVVFIEFLLGSSREYSNVSFLPVKSDASPDKKIAGRSASKEILLSSGTELYRRTRHSYLDGP
ncbi:MAG: hypothetical protein Q4E62_08690, partial [Sutterellaceae bacterium]|nr:hypothetical protein [Sutterellaceae bacterium]